MQSESETDSSEESDHFAGAYTYACKLRYLIILVVIAIFQGSCRPSVPYITNTFFAKQHGGGDCAETPDSDACRRGAIDAAFYHGWFEACANVVAIFFALGLGSYSDSVGRRPLFRMFGSLSVLPLLALAAHIRSGLTLWVFLVLDSLLGAFDINGVFLALMSDLIPNPSERAAAFGTFMGIVMCVAGVVVPCSFLLPQESTVVVSLFAGCVKVTYLFTIFPETATPQTSRRVPGFFEIATHAFKVLTRHSFIFRMAIVLTVSGLGGSGYAIVMSPFLEGYLGFTRKDKLIYFSFAGTSILLTFLLALRPLVSRLGDVGVLRFSMAASVILPICIPFCHSLAQLCVVVAMFLGPIMLSVPVVSAIKSNLVSQNEQGLVQGAVASIGKATATVGFVFFGCLLKVVTQDGAIASQSAAIAPFFMIALFGLLALLLACTLPDEPPPLHQKLAGSETDGLELS